MDDEANWNTEAGQEFVFLVPLPHDRGKVGDGRPGVHRYRSFDRRLGRELRRFRAGYGLTQTEVGLVIGARPSTISQWETGQAVPEGMLRKQVGELLEGRLWTELRSLMLGDESPPRPWREAVRWYRRASREVSLRATCGIAIQGTLQRLRAIDDLVGLQHHYVQGVSAFHDGESDAIHGRRAEDAAYGLRWLEIAHQVRLSADRSLVDLVRADWLSSSASGS